ncbi:MAG: DUF3048 domain-containing protein [Acidobacteriota bacterium]|nr:DUF3048 domain-containing protein [Acidobacteriota bacterium]
MRRRLVIVLLATGALGALAPVAGADTTTSTTSPTTTTTLRPVHTAPLTGRPDPTSLTARRPAVTVKIDNTYEAHPQYGIRQADVVYEEIVEGGITRLAAVFNSSAPARVGPVRSVRRTDREVVYPLGGIFVFSGGAQYALSSIATAPVRLFSESNSGSMMYRDWRRPPPHNLFANVSRLIRQSARPRPPRALFTYSSSPPRAATRVRSFTVGFANGYATSYAWNPKTASWDRSIFGRLDRDASGRRVSPANVIVMYVHYLGGVGALGAEAQLTGSGVAQVFTRHVMVTGRWTRGSLARPIRYLTRSGTVVALSPGQTWVELLDVSEHVAVVR